MSTIVIGSDHAAIAMRRALSAHLAARGWEIAEIGPSEGQRVDYPDQAATVAARILDGSADRGVLCCGTGIGMSIAANKIRGIRAALVHDPVTARLAGEHNDANVLCLGGRLLAEDYGCALVDAWLASVFETRHQPRLDKVAALAAAREG